ncbi:MAG: porin, partial [Proteobacteria bacterium]|nr:porin [Pseudomonadota bacterium]
TPSLGGLTVDAAVLLHEKAAGTNNKNGYDLAANYNMGPLHLGAGYSYADSNYQAGLRALYTFGQFTVGGYYQRNKDENKIVPTGAGTRNNFRLSGMYALGASEFHANVGRANSWSHISSSAATQWTLGYNYNLSKRTKVYGYYTRVNNGNNANYNVTAAGTDFSSFALGVRHNF